MSGTMVWGTVCMLIIKRKIKFDIQPPFPITMTDILLPVRREIIVENAVTNHCTYLNQLKSSVEKFANHN